MTRILSVVFITIFISIAKGEVSVGTDFYFAFPCQLAGISTPSLILVNSNSNQVMVTIDSSIPGFQSMERTISANTGIQVFFSEENDHIVISMQVCDLNNINQQGFRVHTSFPVALYVLQTADNGYSMTQYMVLPVNMLSTQYVGGFNNRYYGMIVANQDFTGVNIGGTLITLNRLDVYYTYATTPTTANVTFSFILTFSSNPNAIQATSVMALPIAYSSTHISIAPSASGTSLTIQIWAITSDATVNVNGQGNDKVSVGRPLEVVLGTTGGAVVSTAPVQIVTNDPYIDYEFTTDNFLSSTVQFYTPNSSVAPTLMIVAPLLTTGNLLFDGQVIPTLQYRRIPNAHDYFCTKQLPTTAGMHTISITTLNDRFLAYVFYPTGTKYTVAMNLTRS